MNDHAEGVLQCVPRQRKMLGHEFRGDCSIEKSNCHCHARFTIIAPHELEIGRTHVAAFAIKCAKKMMQTWIVQNNQTGTSSRHLPDATMKVRVVANVI